MTESWGLAIGLGVVLGAWLGGPAIAIVAVAVLILQWVRGHYDRLFLTVAVACTLAGVVRMAMIEIPQAPVELGSSSGAVLRVESLPRSSANGESVLASAQQLVLNDESVDVDPFTMLLWLPQDERAAPGDTITVLWSVRTFESLSPGYARYVTSRGAVAIGYVDWMKTEDEGRAFYRSLVDLRHHISNGLQRVMPGDAGALAAGIVTGDDSALDESTRDDFLRTGTTHITAVSGSNVAMVLAIWNLVIPAGRNRRLIVIQGLVIVSIWLYALLVGLEPPALRAAIMASLMLLASRFGRRPDLLTLLALTSAAMVLWNPEHVRMVAFWLSVVASGAIIARVPTAPGTGWKTTARGMLEGVALAQITTLPIVLLTFGTWSLTSIFANALLTPLMWLAFPLCFILAFLVVAAPFLASLAAVLPLIPLDLALQIVDILSNVAPPVELHNAGMAGVLAIAVPCVVGGLLLAEDARRWAKLLAKRSQQQPAILAIAIVGPGLGIAIALLMTAFRT